MPTASQPPRRRLGAGMWYQRVPCDPPPETLAQQLADMKVAKKVSDSIDQYETFHHQHSEHHKAVVRGLLGGIGLFLSVAPSVPTLASSCQAGLEWECGLRISAMTGGALALGVTTWGFYDLYKTPTHLSDQVAQINTQIETAMHAKTGEASVTKLLDLYQTMSRNEKTTFRALLQERARQPRNPQAQQRADEVASNVSLTLNSPALQQADDQGSVSRPAGPLLHRSWQPGQDIDLQMTDDVGAANA